MSTIRYLALVLTGILHSTISLDDNVRVDVFSTSYCQKESEVCPRVIDTPPDQLEGCTISYHCRFLEEITSTITDHCLLMDYPENYLLKISKSKLPRFSDISIRCPERVMNLQMAANHIKLVNFTSMSNLKELNLSNNELNDLSESNFSGLVSLSILDLSNNSLTIFNDIIVSKSNIQELCLSSNKISDLVLNMLTLQKLDVSKNDLAFIEPKYFFEVKNLKYLDLSYNKIYHLSFGTFDQLNKLEYLDLSHNKLTTIAVHYFHSLTGLLELNISYNELTSINLSSLRGFKVNLAGNQMSCDHLMDIVLEINKNEIKVQSGDFKNGTNILGISCTVDKSPLTYKDGNTNSAILLIMNVFMLAILVVCMIVLIYMMYSILRFKRSSNYRNLKRKTLEKSNTVESHIYNDLSFEK